MSRFKRYFMAALVALSLMMMVGPALADGPGLGSNWPTAPDVSANPQFHVYRWVANGITYVQVNDIAGNVKLAVGVVGSTVFVLPMGSPALVNVLPASQSAPASDTPIYSDSTITVSQPATPSAINVKASPMICTNPADCSG